MRLEEYYKYHDKMLDIGDIDPSYPALRYLSDRFELNIEQKYWIAFLYSCCYSVPTVFFMYNEFPDYEYVDLNRVGEWWVKNKSKLLFQTDRKRIKNKDQFVETIASYREVLGGLKQATAFNMEKGKSRFETYDNIYKRFSKLKNFGRYSLFLFTEAVYQITDYPMEASTLDLEDAESSCNGLLYALGRDAQIGTKLRPEQYKILYKSFDTIMDRMREKSPRNNVWNVETTLCAYKKLKLGKRYLGYYIDRQKKEIEKMQSEVQDGVDWSVLRDFRKEYFNHIYLKECKN